MSSYYTLPSLAPFPGAEAYNGTRTLVLGASGFIGRWVARSLCAAGAEVSLVVRSARDAARTFAACRVRGKVIAADLCQPEAIGRLFAAVKPAITFNLAAYGVDPSERDEGLAYQVNAQLVQAVAKAAAESRAPHWPGQDVVHTGSALEYGNVGGDVSEDSRPNPTTWYGRSKLAGTCLLADGCRRFGLKGLTARLFTVYGPGEHPGRLLPALLEAALTGKPLPLTRGSQQRDFAFVKDVAEGLLRLGLGHPPSGEVVNLATGRLTSVRHFAEEAARVMGIRPDRLRFGSLPIRPEEMSHGEVSLARLRQLVGWVPPTSVEQGLARTWAFQRTRQAA
jgi:nucleoside-diphosphate-sugar epimerase